MRLRRPGATVIHRWPSGLPDTAQATFVLRVPNAQEGRDIQKCIARWLRDPERFTILDAARTVIGICLERVENLTDESGDPVIVEKVGKDLAESTLGILQPAVDFLMKQIQDLGRLTPEEEKNF